jgi:RNA 2',3'-cyclic 3'-phosphodiesterase
MSIHRLFVALRPPESVRRQLTAIMSGVDGARWQDDAQLHLTLRYIGEVDHQTANAITIALASIRTPPVTIALDGIGVFARKEKPHTLWAGVSPCEHPTSLNRKINRALAPLALEPQDHGYIPHVTVARGSMDGGVEAWCADHAALSSADFTLDSFGLYESHLTNEGSHYQLITCYPLRADD